MRALLTVFVLALAAPDREDPTPREKTKPIHEQILGEWQLVNSVVGGRNEKKDGVLTFTRTEIHITENGQRRSGDDADYVIDATKKPAAIDISVKRDGSQKIEGILKIEGDQLTLCFPRGGGAMRPTDFVSTPQTGIAVMQFTRIKK